MFAGIKLSTFTKPHSYAPLSGTPLDTPPENPTEDLPGASTRQAQPRLLGQNSRAGESSSSTYAHGPLDVEQQALGHYAIEFDSSSKGKGRLSEASGHYYSHNTVGGHAHAHFGNVFNYRDEGSEENRILKWLSPIDPAQTHSEACVEYQIGTLRWFFEDVKFLAWRDDWESQHASKLWCQGSLGTGKTVLTAQIVAHLHNGGVAKPNIAVVYCRYAERKAMTAEHLLGSILTQLYQSDDQGYDIPLHVKAAYKPKLWLRMKPNLKQVTDWLCLKLLADERPTFIIVDACDELSPLSRQNLLHTLGSMLHTNLRILITSRHLPEDDGRDLYESRIIEFCPNREDMYRSVKTKILGQRSERFQQLISGKAARDSAFETAEDEIVCRIVELSGDM